ncbi:MAG: M20 family metallopeptidase, partial [Planctomycetes bacterium]|nr:M20 family metallopeptidase [Planctomycetota bacterium]
MNVDSVAQAASSEAFRRHLTDLLVKICGIDTVPRSDVAATAQAESQVFDIIEHEVKGYGLERSRCVRLSIDPAIAEHPFFSQPYYTRTPENPSGLPVKRCYAGRSNLVIQIDGDRRHAAGVGQALNAHIDVVAPYYPPRVEGNVVFGRGACDDKGSVVAIAGALKLLGEHLRTTGCSLNRDLTCMIVIEEEPGGNGSLSLAIDRDL